MKKIDLKEFERLIHQILKEEDLEEQDIDMASWIPGEPEIKELLKQKENNIINSSVKNVDLQTSEEISKEIDLKSNIVVGKFIIKIIKRHTNGNYNIFIYYYKTDKVVEKFSPLKDKRFERSSWLKYFNNFKMGSDIPKPVLLDIIKWLRAVDKLKAFI